MNKKQSLPEPSHSFAAVSCRHDAFVFHCILDNGALIHFSFSEEAHRQAVSWLKQKYHNRFVSTNPNLEKYCLQFAAYLSGQTETLPTAGESPFFAKATPFQRAVWDLISQIPYGETRTYKQLAEKLRRKGAARAVGQACGKNPLALIIPCHRVIGCCGSMGGFAGGVAVKERLLAMEQRKLAP